MLILIALSFTLSAALAAPQQDPFPKPGADPTGVVLDEDGKRIAGAKVSLRCDLARSVPYARVLEEVLRRWPLPSGVSDKDGEFVLPLLPEQRQLGLASEGCFAVIVEKDGYQRWCERLPHGIAGYLGSRVVLYRLDESDRVTVKVGAVEPGTRLEIARLWRDDPDPGESVLVPADGKVSVQLPLVPSPRPLLLRNAWLALGYRARLVRDQLRTDWLPIDPGGIAEWPDGIRPSVKAAKPSGELAKAAPAGKLRVIVRDASGAAVRHAFVLVEDRVLAPGSAPSSCLTDEQGTARFAVVDGGTIQVRIGVAGSWPEHLPCQIGAAGEAKLEVTLRPAYELRVVTHDAAARPAPFVPFMLRVFDLTKRPSLQFSRDGLSTDSLGRALVPVPEERASVALLDAGSSHLAVNAGAAEAQRVLAKTPGWTLVRTPPGMQVRELIATEGAPAPEKRDDASDRGAVAVLLRNLATPKDSLCLYSNGAIPIFVRGTELANAPRVRGLAMLDHSGPAKEIPLRIVDQLGRPIAGACVRLAQRDRGEPRRSGADGTLGFPIRGRSSVQLLVYHPEYLSGGTTVPDRDRPNQEPIEVRLIQGAALSLRFTPRAHGLEENQPMEALVTFLSTGNQFEGRNTLQIPAFAGDAMDRPFTISLPHARTACAQRVRVLCKFDITRDVELVNGKTVVIDFDEGLKK